MKKSSNGRRHRIKIQETAAELEALIQQQSNPNLKERLLP